MIVIPDDGRQAILLAIPWPDIRQLIQIRIQQNELNKQAKKGFLISGFIVMEPNDPARLVEKEIVTELRKVKVDRPIDAVFTPSFEWIIEHPTCYEAAFIHCDREYGVCVMIPKAGGIDADLLAMCVEYSVPAPVLAVA